MRRASIPAGAPRPLPRKGAADRNHHGISP
jgi:hypothetical protein